ncbi:class I SAM-dependent methyltransferase [bacterium]|nr:class I SAM-dependent methyltransferase [bacterium]
MSGYESQMQRAVSLLQNGETHAARNILSSILSTNGGIKGLHFLHGYSEISLGRYPEGMAYLQKEVTSFPDNEDAQRILENIRKQASHHTAKPSEDEEFRRILSAVSFDAEAILPIDALHHLYTMARKVCEEHIPGNFVVCGANAIVESALLAYVAKKFSLQPRWVYIFKDGEAEEFQAKSRINIEKLGFQDIVKPIRGTIGLTLNAWRDRIGMTSLLTILPKSSNSATKVISSLSDRISSNGFIQLNFTGDESKSSFSTGEAGSNLVEYPARSQWEQTYRKAPNKKNPEVSEGLYTNFLDDDPAFRGVVSQMSANERFQLYYACRSLLPNRFNELYYVEIGSWEGASLRMMHTAFERLNRPVHGFAIEPNVRNQFSQTLLDLGSVVSHLKMMSDNAAPLLAKRFEEDGIWPELIFVDGDHTREGVSRDIEAYWELLAPGGLMILHDFLPELDDANRDAISFLHGGGEPGIRQACLDFEAKKRVRPLSVPLLYTNDPTQTQAHLPIIPGVYSTVRIYKRPE